MSESEAEINWDDGSSLVGLVFKAKAHKHGLANVKGMWAYVAHVKALAGKERAVKMVVRFYATKGAAEGGKRGESLKEDVASIKQLRNIYEGMSQAELVEEVEDMDGDSDGVVVNFTPGGRPPPPKSAPAHPSRRGAGDGEGDVSKSAAKRAEREEKEKSEKKLLLAATSSRV